MKRCAGWVAVGLLAVAGCQDGKTPGTVARPPEPVVPGDNGSPAPKPLPKPQQTQSPTRPPEGWLPSKGLSNGWQCIVIHHTASDTGSLRDIDQWHRDKGWDCCGYHFVIGNGTHAGNGQIQVGPRWRDQLIGAHTRLYGRPGSNEGNYYNEHGIGVVLVGNFDKSRPTPSQMAALAKLVKFLMAQCGIPAGRVYLHGDLKSTDCPGHFFSRADLNNRVKALQ